MKKLLISSLLVLFACASHAQAPRKTGVLREPVQIPLVMNGKQVGTSTVAAGTKVQVVSEADGKVQISISGGEAWVAPEIVDVQAAPLAPVVAAATPAAAVSRATPALASMPKKEAPAAVQSGAGSSPATTSANAQNTDAKKADILYVLIFGEVRVADIARVDALRKAGYTVATAARQDISQEKLRLGMNLSLISSEPCGVAVDTLLEDANADNYKVVFFGCSWRGNEPAMRILKEAADKHKIIVAEVPSAKWDVSYIEEQIAGKHSSAEWHKKTLGCPLTPKDQQFVKLKGNIIIYNNDWWNIATETGFVKASEDTEFCNKKIIPAIKTALGH